VCDLENLKNEDAMPRVGSQRQSKKKYIYIYQKANITKQIFVNLMEAIPMCLGTIKIG